MKRVLVMVALVAGCSGPRLVVDGSRVEVTGLEAVLDDVQAVCRAADGEEVTAPRCRAWVDDLGAPCGSWARASELGLYATGPGSLMAENTLVFDAGVVVESCDVLVGNKIVASWPIWQN